MGITGFAEGLGKGITSGVALGESIVKGRNRAGVAAANDALIKLENMNPFDGDGRGAIDAGGGETSEAPTGYDGLSWDAGKQEYMKAMRRVTDPETLKFLRNQLIETERGKVLDYGNMAISALDNGDYDAAQRYFAGMSFYTNPGVTPTILVQPDGNLTVESEDGLAAFTRDDASDLVRRMVDFPGWQQLTFDRQQAAETIKHDNAVLAAQIANNAAKLAINQQEADSRGDANDALIDLRGAQEAGAIGDEARDALAAPGKRDETAASTERYKALAKAAADKVDRDNAAYLTGLDKAAREQRATDRAADEAAFNGFITDPDVIAKAQGYTPDDGASLAGTSREEVTDGPDIPGAIAESELATNKNLSYAQEMRAQIVVSQRQMESYLRKDGGEGRAVASMIMSALRSGDADMDSELVAYLAVQAVMGEETDGKIDAEYDAMMIGGVWYGMDPYFIQLLQGKMDGRQLSHEYVQPGNEPLTVRSGLDPSDPLYSEWTESPNNRTTALRSPIPEPQGPS